MDIQNDRGVSDLLRTTEETRICSGFTFTEGPVWLPDRGCLLFSDIPGNRILRWWPGNEAAEVYREPSRNSNGLTLDLQGRLLACEHSGRQVTRAGYEEREQILVDRFDGRRFNSPNDIVVHSSGAIYFTDPPYGLRGLESEKELDFQGVYRLGPDGELSVVVDDFTAPNGLTFSPDESVLYIGDSEDKIIRRFPVESDGSLGEGELFVDMSDDDRRGAPDGMKVDEQGRLWTTGTGGVWVVEPDGTRLGVFETEEHAANLTFGGPDFSTLYLTAQTSVYSVETAVRGVAPGSRS